MKVPKQILNAMTNIALAHGAVHAMGGIHFTRQGGKCCAEVTDGRMLLRVQWQDGSKKKNDFETTISADSVKRSQNGVDLSVELCETDIAIVDNQAIETVNGNFRKLDDVIPNYDHEECHVFKVDPIRLIKILKAAVSVVPLGDPQSVTIVCPLDDKKPIRFDLKGKYDGVSVVAVLMPIGEKTG